jgi:two-component system nitrate/nitrite response regulator NarL
MVVIASAAESMLRRARQGLQGKFAIHEVTHHSALVTSMAKLKPEFLLLDVDLPRLGSVRGVPAIQRLNPQTAIIVLTSAVDEREGVWALKAGARGYCSKDIGSALLRKAMERIQDGEIWAGRKIVSNFLDELASLTALRQRDSTGRIGKSFQRLSSRQREIAHLVAAGASNRQIAHRLDVREKTVKAYLTAIFLKLGLSNRLQLALLVTEYAGLSRMPSRFSRATG